MTSSVSEWGASPAPAAEQPQDRTGRAIAQVHRGDALFAIVPSDLVGGFDKHREADGSVEVTLGNMEAKAFDDQAETDHHQEAKAENDDGRMLVDEGHQGFGCEHHDANGNDDRDHHDFEIFHHADGGDDAIEREYGIEDDDLRNDLPENRMRGIAFLGGHMAFQPLMQLHRALEQQEDAAEDEDDIAPGKIEAGDAEQWRGQL